MKELQEAYFKRRRENIALRMFTSLFEDLPWLQVGKTAVRSNADRWKLLVYRVEGGIEICVISPAGDEQKFGP